MNALRPFFKNAIIGVWLHNMEVTTMAFDGLVIAALTDEFSRALTGGRIQKIYQPEAEWVNDYNKKWTHQLQAAAFRKRLSAAGLFYRKHKGKSCRCPEFLYASPKAPKRR